MTKSQNTHDSKEPHRVIKPLSNSEKDSSNDSDNDIVNDVNESIKALDPSLDSNDIKTIDDDGKPMPELIPAKKAEDDEDILKDDNEVISDELTEPLEDEDQLEPEPDADSEPEEVLDDDESEKEKQQPKEVTDKNNDSEENETDVPEDGVPDDPVIEKAVKEIVAEESDAVLAAEDKAHLSVTDNTVDKSKDGIFAKFLSFWATKKGKKVILGSTFLTLFIIALVPFTRYFTLNALGVRSTMQVRVIDSGTLQPIKNVSVRAGGSEGLTDDDGVATLNKVKLGRTNLKIDKRAFAPIEQAVTIGWGSNPLGEFSVEAVGTQYTVVVTDYLSGKPIAKAQASSGDGNATSDEEGKFVLTLDTAELDDSAEISINVLAENYREESLNITVNNRETQSVEMVPDRKHVFVTKRSGKYDVYTAHIDGKNEDKIVGGSGLERDDITLVPHQTNKVAAFISTRENARNASGFLLSTLYIVETDSGEITKIDQSEKIQIIGWSAEGRLVYVKVAAGASGTDPKRHRIMSFDSNDYSGFKELASSNSFNDVVMAEDKIYYAPSNIFQENPEPGTFVISPTGEDKFKVLDKETFAIVRSGYDVFYLNTGNDWFTYSISSGGDAKPAEAPSSQVSRIYLENPDGKSSLWVDERDGKGVLIRYDKESGEEESILTRSGLKMPVYWLTSSTLVFRVFDGTESADYVISFDGGEARKIIDVTNTSGISRWFYY